MLCEENIVNATFAFSSPNTDYQLLDSEGSGIGYNYSFWASRCAGMAFIFTLDIKFHRYDIYIITGYRGMWVHCLYSYYLSRVKDMPFIFFHLASKFAYGWKYLKLVMEIFIVHYSVQMSC